MPDMSLRPGEVFAGYSIDRELGAGGMGSVYLARHPRLPRFDALKLLRPELCTDPGFVGRFEREADTVAQLDHPNIVPVYDRGSQDGQLWISMRFIDGTNAEKALADQGGGGLAPERVVRIVSKVASALDYAHKQQLLHRDVKPANILITPGPEDDEDAERVFLSDFGVAKAIGAAAERISSLTSTGSVVATLDYASPEQIKGQVLDHRSDIYALGCVLYKLLTGTVPYPGESVAARVYGHLNNDAPPPSSIDPRLPAGFDAVVATAMAKDAADRYPTCRALATAARAALTSPAADLGPPAEDPDAGFPTIMTTSAGIIAAGQRVQPGQAGPGSEGAAQAGHVGAARPGPGQAGAAQPGTADPMPPWLGSPHEQGASQGTDIQRPGPPLAGTTGEQAVSGQPWNTGPHTAREQAEPSWPGQEHRPAEPDRGRRPPDLYPAQHYPAGNGSSDRPPPADGTGGPPPADRPPPDPSGGPVGSSARRRTTVIAAATAAVVLIGAITAFVLLRGDVAGTASTATGTGSAAAQSTAPPTPSTSEEPATSAEPSTSAPATSSAITPPLGPVPGLPHSEPLPEQVLLASRTIGGETEMYQFDATTGAIGAQLTKGGGGAQYPILSPDRGSVIYVQNSAAGSELRTMAVDGSGDRTLFPKEQWPQDCTNVYRPAWNTADPTLLTLSCVLADDSTAVHVVTVDGADLAILDLGFPIVDDITYSLDGTTMAYWGSESRAAGNEGTIFIRPAQGEAEPMQLVERVDGTSDADPTFSPDGSRIAFRRVVEGGGVDGGASAHIYVVNTDGSDLVQLTDGTAIDQDPIWSPDGTQLAFKSNRPDSEGRTENQIWVMNADGTNIRELGVGTPGTGDGAPAWGHR
jgi:hypothetical protein